MSVSIYASGDLVVLRTHDRVGQSGVVSKPILDDCDGQALVYHDGAVVSVDVGQADVEFANEGVGDWAQLAHSLISLGSHIIEKRLLIYRD